MKVIWNPWKEIKRLNLQLDLVKEKYDLLKIKHEIQTEMLKQAQKNDNRGPDGRFKKTE
jgi:hypothetical protein